MTSQMSMRPNDGLGTVTVLLKLFEGCLMCLLEQEKATYLYSTSHSDKSGINGLWKPEVGRLETVLHNSTILLNLFYISRVDHLLRESSHLGTNLCASFVKKRSELFLWTTSVEKLIKW